jgi:1-acyl-sn-glycerol-3-phosphate acyltransferase
MTRGILRLLGRILLYLFFRIEVIGKDKFPKEGPLIVIGNHSAIMETATMTVFTPWQVEFLGSVDIPHERFAAFFANLFGFIPIKRGHVDRPGLRKALGVLGQGGIIGIFPEGGIWEPGGMRPQTGVSWLSYRGTAPVLPLGFSGSKGALGAALRFKRPLITMNVGDVIPPAKLQVGKAKKESYEEFAEHVMQQVNELLPESEDGKLPLMISESFDLKVEVKDEEGDQLAIPDPLELVHKEALAKFLHRPPILKIFRVNYHMPVEVLEELHTNPSVEELITAVKPILSYLEEENPYMLAYRFGPKQGEAMKKGLDELFSLLQWAEKRAYKVKVVPIRKYQSSDMEGEVVQERQEKFVDWM